MSKRIPQMIIWEVLRPFPYNAPQHQLEICEQHLLYFALLLLGVESKTVSQTLILFGVRICAYPL